MLDGRVDERPIEREKKKRRKNLYRISETQMQMVDVNYRRKYNCFAEFVRGNAVASESIED